MGALLFLGTMAAHETLTSRWAEGAELLRVLTSKEYGEQRIGAVGDSLLGQPRCRQDIDDAQERSPVLVLTTAQRCPWRNISGKGAGGDYYREPCRSRRECGTRRHRS